MLMLHRYAEQEAVIQVLWFYQRPLHVDGLRRFHRNLGHGILARRIARSPLPFGRARWLSVPTPQAELELTDSTMPAGQRHEWADQQVNLPLDPELGPAWQLSAQKFSDGSTMVSLVISHCIADGVATIIAICDAINGTVCDLDYPSSTSRNCLSRLLSDLLRFTIDLPAIFTALGSGAKMVMKQLHAGSSPEAKKRTNSPVHQKSFSSYQADRDQHIHLPSVSLFTDANQWDQLARSRGGNRFTLLAAVASSVAERMGRRQPGASHLSIPINLRQESMDTGANRVTIAQITIADRLFGTDLSQLRKTIKKGLIAARRSPDAMFSLLPLIPLLPGWAFRRALERALSLASHHSITCSHMGNFPEEFLMIDGSEADTFCFRGLDQHSSNRKLERRHGVFTLLSGAMRDLIIMNFIAYQPGRSNTRQDLQGLIQEEINELGLKATFF